MTTMVDDCQFVCITQQDYYKILHEGEDALVKEEEDGVLVKVSEVRRAEDGIKHVQVLLRATPEKLINQLIEDTNSADPNYIEAIQKNYYILKVLNPENQNQKFLVLLNLFFSIKIQRIYLYSGFCIIFKIRFTTVPSTQYSE